jgi:MFS family permease
MRTPTIWLLMISFALASMGLMGMLVHTYPYLTDIGFSPGEAARGLSMIGIAGLICKPVWGLLIERFQGRRCAAAEFLLCAAGIVAIALARGEPAMYGAIFLFGLGVGGVITVQEVIWADYFGRLTLGRIRSVAMPFTIVSSAGGPVFAGWVYDVSGAYRAAFLVFITTYLIATVLILLTRRPRPPQTVAVGDLNHERTLQNRVPISTTR